MWYLVLSKYIYDDGCDANQAKVIFRKKDFRVKPSLNEMYLVPKDNNIVYRR